MIVYRELSSLEKDLGVSKKLTLQIVKQDKPQLSQNRNTEKERRHTNSLRPVRRTQGCAEKNRRCYSVQ